jgi:hypothetical protein
LPHAVRRPGHAALPIVIATALMSALLLFSISAVSVPTQVLGASTKAAACNANLRAKPYVSAKLKKTIKTNTRVTVATTVTGGRWRVTCAGKTVSGRSWYRISAINGKSVRSLFGRSYLYGATGLFKAVSTSTTLAPLPPPPPSGTRPFAAPATSRTVTVPSTIDSTGATNAGPALQSFVNGLPDGSIIVFRAGGVYRMDRGLFLVNRHHLVFEGNGATLRGTGSSTLIAATPILIDGANSDIAVRNFTIEGSNGRTGTSIYDPYGEGQQGVGVYGGLRIEIANNTIRKTWGDGVYANEKNTTHTWTTDLWVHDNRIVSVGRNAFTMNGARNALLERNTIDQVGGSVLDIEPDTTYQGAINVTMRNNSVGVWGLSPLYTMWFVACANNDFGPGAVVRDITITGNHVSQGAPNSAKTPNAGGLSTWFGKSRTSNIVVTNNTTTKAGAGPVLRFVHVDGLTVTGNSQPLSSGSLLYIYDSTGVTR